MDVLRNLNKLAYVIVVFRYQTGLSHSDFDDHESLTMIGQQS